MVDTGMLGSFCFLLHFLLHRQLPISAVYHRGLGRMMVLPFLDQLLILLLCVDAFLDVGELLHRRLEFVDALKVDQRVTHSFDRPELCG